MFLVFSPNRLKLLFLRSTNMSGNECPDNRSVCNDARQEKPSQNMAQRKFNNWQKHALSARIVNFVGH